MKLKLDPRISLALPAYGGTIHVGFSESLAQSLRFLRLDSDGETRALIGHYAYLKGDSLVNRARNNLVAEFLQGVHAGGGEGQESETCKFEWLMFIDTDIIFQPADIAKLYQVAQKHGPGIYAGGYAMKSLEGGKIYNPLPGASIDTDGVVEVREAGTGFMLIHREVFLRMADEYQDEIEYVTDATDGGKSGEIRHDFFTVGVRYDPVFKRKRFLSEDWYFCQRWHEMGGRILFHTHIQCQHVGQMTYPVPESRVLAAASRIERSKKS